MKTEHSPRASVKDNRGIKVIERVTVNCPAEKLFTFWRNLENLPRFMSHLESVRVVDEKRSHWVAKAPAGRTIEWDAEIINERSPELIAWRSTEGSEVDNAGSVRFEPAHQARGTVVTVALEYVPPAGVIGRAIARLFGEEPAQQISADLWKLKAYMETGEIPTVEGQPHGARH